MAKLAQKRIEFKASYPYMDGMNQLIDSGLYVNQTEIIKDALRRLLIHYNIQLIQETEEQKMEIAVKA
jgi:Arc/MetJ-type ribon-helix-helix transcriptional regulator